jgi:hypothetical protein
MALLFLGQSECALCGNILQDSFDLRGFPPLTSNMNDPLFIFSDAGVHESCLKKHPLVHKVLFYREKLFSQVTPLICNITGEKIEDPNNNYIGFNILTSESEEPVSQFNFLQMNKRHLHLWNNRALFIETATQYIAEGKWNGFMRTTILQQLIDKVK